MLSPLIDDQSFWKTHGMARTIGVDLTGALATGALDRRSLAGMIAGCGACAEGLRCTDWLAECGGAEDAPPFCRLRNVFAQLKARQS